jgi:transposase
LIVARAEAAAARAQQSDDQALIAHLKLQIEKLNRDRYGPRSEHRAAAGSARIDAGGTGDHSYRRRTRRRNGRSQNNEGGVVHAQAAVPQTVPGSSAPRTRDRAGTCGLQLLRRIAAVQAWRDITETLEVIPKSWKVIQHVREKLSCRDCEKISQAPAPFHVIARGWAGPSLLAMVLFEKFGQHQPLNRQAERYAKEGVPISLSTLADQVGGCTAALMPLFKRLEAYVLSAERLQGDDTRVPVLAKGKTDTGRIWVYVRDDKPFGGPAPPGAVFYYSRDRAGKHPQAHQANYTGIFQADAYEGYGKLYEQSRVAGLDRSWKRPAGSMPGVRSS